MSEIKDGGPAFPFEEKHTDGTHYHSHSGLSLRDFFAAKALAGLLAYPGDEARGNYHTNSSPEYVARDAYLYADAMLKARGQS